MLIGLMGNMSLPILISYMSIHFYILSKVAILMLFWLRNACKVGVAALNTLLSLLSLMHTHVPRRNMCHAAAMAFKPTIEHCHAGRAQVQAGKTAVSLGWRPLCSH